MESPSERSSTADRLPLCGFSRITIRSDSPRALLFSKLNSWKSNGCGTRSTQTVHANQCVSILSLGYAQDGKQGFLNFS